MTKEISRRSFLQGIGLAGAATVGVGLAGCAPAAPVAEGEKLSDTGDQAHRWSWEAGPEDISEDQIVETVEHEFVVAWRVWPRLLRWPRTAAMCWWSKRTPPGLPAGRLSRISVP